MAEKDDSSDETEARSPTVDTTQPPEEIDAGNSIDEFLIIRGLGSGAFARVYLARQESMQRLVALKVSHGTGGESQTLAKLDHPNIVRVFDQRSVDQPPCHLLYMQYVPGGTLAEVVQLVRDGVGTAKSSGFCRGDILLEAVDQQLLQAAHQRPERSSVRDWVASASWASVVAWIGIQLAHALDDAHKNGVLHRDVKPANVLLSAEGIPKLADFNVSFATSSGDTQALANFGGSIAYMSPEHLAAVSPHHDGDREDVKESADLYSLAVLLWELWQGNRPFKIPQNASSLTQMMAGHIDARDRELSTPWRSGDPSERVLESALRRVLAKDISSRPTSGAEVAARLKLALHPEVAGIFDPEPTSWRYRLLCWSPWLLATIVMLLPNIAAGIFNFLYNHNQVIMPFRRLEGFDSVHFEASFKKLALFVNLIAFPVGAGLMVWRTRPVVSAMASAGNGDAIESRSFHDVIALSYQAALIGSGLWLIAGVIYPTALMMMFPEFAQDQAIHFFLSLMICGFVAAVYPFFGMMLMATKVYYPRLQRDVMHDEHFEARFAAVKRLCTLFLLAAAVIPLVGLLMLLSQTVTAKWTMLVAVIASAAGLCATFWAYEQIVSNWRKMSVVLGNQRGPTVAD